MNLYYVRDPQGNVLAVYEHKHGDSDNGTFTLTEQHLYGAGRLGMKKRDLALNVANASESTPVTHYELTNHLGNVMAVISDEASSSDEPTVVSLSDYYPFGMTEPGRSWNADDYRFGYTGHERENDLADGVYTTEYRLLDTRLGRWMSMDPLFMKYASWSPYNYSEDNPIWFVDKDGLRAKISQGGEDLTESILDDIFYDFPATRNLFYVDRNTGFLFLDKAGISPARAAAMFYIRSLNISAEEKEVMKNAYLDIMEAFEKIVDSPLIATVVFDPNETTDWGGGRFRVDETDIDVNNPCDGTVFLDNVNPVEECVFKVGDTPSNDDLAVASLAELFCHELLGHGVGYFERISQSVDQFAIAMSNSYLKLKRAGVLRSGLDHACYDIKNTNFKNDPYTMTKSQDARPNFKQRIYKDEQDQIEDRIPNIGASSDQ